MKLTRLFALIITTAVFVACGGDSNGDDQKFTPKGNVKFTADCVSVEVNKPITFTVIAEDGTDITAEATIMDRTDNRFAIVPNPFTPTEDGEYTFFATGANFISSDIKVNVVPSIPALPVDAQPENTSFNHRILLVDHSGTNCGWCPQMMKILHEIANEESDYHSKYYEVVSHSFNNNDPASSDAAYFVKKHFRISNFPSLTYNFYHDTVSSHDGGAPVVKAQIDRLWKAEGANVGIAATTSLATKCVVVNTEVKAAATNDYRITAWLLQDGIEALQSGGLEDWMHIHNNALRQRVNVDTISGVDLGNIAAGEIKSETLTLDISKINWDIHKENNKENFKVLIIASEKNDKGRFEVANVALCHIDQSVTYDYKE